ncbi:MULTISPECIES: ABC transporter permease subunit [unclassified Pseudomonas]|uniref:ABC transporter permease subunit n=1 Tax=unclassified Pseudomonas TaxID=196821 RepID=UPI000BDCE4EF|nr:MULTISPECIES: ABC transporter permease subunit [unclassified Pseudomonas]PVZ10465.1 phosphate transport system permease protein [Pseudomonas sp. URIL14HWK12:I12]PVZ21891.1 phosphate transport system permease protein [Pseudomonas sp. URIL14HWK12:I10]PVZ31026.1 phosphate transport system permease protein [Pseudomonas sp. URIL14HWK12:I11]SNZ17573.1 phosphate transport system permease protein [Pseudomonas sp. URIL14HWK12:I9]
MNDLTPPPVAPGYPAHRIDFNAPAFRRKRRLRAWVDRLTRGYVLVGGLGVLAAVTLIFFYLAWVVLPLFQGASLSAQPMVAPAWLQEAGKPLLLTVEEQNLVGLRVSSQGEVVFFNTQTGAPLQRIALPIPPGVHLVSVAKSQPGTPWLVAGLSNGQALVMRTSYKLEYPDNVKVVSPVLEFPYGKAPLTVDTHGQPLEQVAITVSDTTLLIAGSSGAALSVLSVVERDDAPAGTLAGQNRREQANILLPQMTEPVKALFLDPRQQWLYVINGRAQADVFDLRQRSLNGRYKLLEDGKAEVTASRQLVGGTSLMIGTSKGTISQWFMARDVDGEPRLNHIRDFKLGDAPIEFIRAEERRKGFIALDHDGVLGVFHSTAHRTLLTQQVVRRGDALALSPRADHVLVEEQGRWFPFGLSNPHPEVSWSALWDKVWYENYDKPEYVWQSTAANSDFEPKLSLAPLTFGTLKAALYAMLLAAPLAIAAAIYTAYFMAAPMRRKVKPVIEMMEAMPTVILGFIAGLFLAPYVEGHLPGIFALLLFLPVGIVLAGWCWSRLPADWRLSLAPGWESAVLIPVILMVVALSLWLSPRLETLLFGGDMRQWVGTYLGLGFDQRNALVVGLAMGFAVIPTIYSIAEDAIFSVPRGLTHGSLALGATPWQTLTRVVILTASPGIFSALMIGLGRAVGETMIVLMATGNTPIMDMNLFEGMRTLAANVAVEMPEAEVGSSHYRVLFLAALVLLLFTFVMNTLAEVIRQRLRKKYSSL